MADGFERLCNIFIKHLDPWFLYILKMYHSKFKALLFWFFGDFRCDALLFMVIHVVYKYKNR